MRSFFTSFVCIAILGACGDTGGGGGGSTPKVNAVLFSTGLAAQNFERKISKANFLTALSGDLFKPYAAATLTNIKGYADSLLALTTEDGCGFSAWSANSQTGEVAVEGRTYEAFDLDTPSDWTSMGTGIREGCSGGTLIGAEAYFAYVDFYVTVSANPAIVRIAMGQTGSYKAGDVLVDNGSGVFYWIDSSGNSLAADTATRPSTAYQYSAISDFVPFIDGGSTKNTILDKVSISISEANKLKSVSQDTKKVVFDLDLSSVAITANAGTDGQIAASISIPIFSASVSTLTATITPLSETEEGTSTDPFPSKGNGSE